GTEVDEDELARFEDKARDIEKLLARCRPQRLGLYEHNGLMFSQPLEVLELVMMGRAARVPLVRGHLGSAIYGERVIFGRETVEVRAHDASRFVGLFGIREY
ncbi:transporter, partial [Escherichia coli]|uniref:VirB4 family type IV secretion/conjugal transfer ATPase n=1 Tax=Escherichia coli TaxID=562 RepID=UPI000F932072